LPGVEAERSEVTIEEGDPIVPGVRVLPPELRHAVIHRPELPQGRFERQVPLPAGKYSELRSGSAQTRVLGSPLEAQDARKSERRYRTLLAPKDVILFGPHP
jgi:hypothetical protein